MAKKPKLTAWEKAQIVRLEFKGLKQAAAGITDQPDLDRRIERIKDKARRRAENGQ